MIPPAPRRALPVIGGPLRDAVQGQVIDVNMAIRWTPREGERGGVG